MSRWSSAAAFVFLFSPPIWAALPCCSSSCTSPNLLDTSQCACCCSTGAQCTACCNSWPAGQNRQRCLSSCFAEFPAQPAPELPVEQWEEPI